jgi:polygalacturonase
MPNALRPVERPGDLRDRHREKAANLIGSAKLTGPPGRLSCPVQTMISPPLLVRPLALITLAAASVAAGLAADVSFGEDFKPALPVIPERTFALTDYGAVGDGHTLNTEAFHKAIAAVEKSGGGRLIVPKGVFRTLSFSLCSQLDLHLEEGAVIQAPDTFAAYGLPDPATLHSQDEVQARVRTPEPLIGGGDLHDVAITGTGVIDGNGALWWAWSERAARASAQPGRLVYHRAHLVVINGCQRLHVADITLTNSPMFHLVPRNVTDLTVERVKVRAPFDAPNTDAIDPGPVTNALNRDCDIDTGDDDIVIKSGGTNVLIENCTIKHGHGISIGSGTTGGVHNMLVRHCTFDGTDNGIRIKSMRGAGGPVTRIRYTDIRMKNVTNAFSFQLDYVDNNRPDFKGDPGKIPSLHGILIDQVVVENATHAGKIIGLPDSPITCVTFRNVQLTAESDFIIKDAEPPVFENVTRNITKGVGPAGLRIIE